MKKLQSTWYNMVIVLTLISVVAGAALGYVNSVTEAPIQEIKAQQLADGIREVLNNNDVDVAEPETTESGAIIYRTDKGTAVQATDPNGFGGKLSVLVGFGEGGEILGYRVMETSETPGLGAKAQQWFQKDGKGNIIGKQGGALTVSKDGGEVDAITASTITSRAFLRCVNAAYEALQTKQTDVESSASPQHHEAAAQQEESKTDKEGGNE